LQSHDFLCLGVKRVGKGTKKTAKRFGLKRQKWDLGRQAGFEKQGLVIGFSVLGVAPLFRGRN
jgi:hypothetical protein